jgi:hypothetical protein
MSQPLQIYQYQPVVFTSTSSGAEPLTFLWSFPGGSPLSSTSESTTIYYNVPGYYNVSLTATDVYGTSKTLSESNLIEVFPSTFIPGISGPTPSIVKMSEVYTVQDASIANPYPVTSWYWNLPYGQTSSSQVVGVTGYSDWFILTGGYTASPGSSYTGNILLTAGNSYSIGSATGSVEVLKLGPSETMYLNATGPAVLDYVTGMAGGLVLDLITNNPLTDLDFGYTGGSSSNFVYKLDFSSRGSDLPTKVNQYFHSDLEQNLTSINTGMWVVSNTPPYLTTNLPGYLMVDPALYSGYTPLVPGDGISLGRYLIPYQSFYLFFSDTTGLLYDIYTNHNYKTDLIDYLLINPYPIIHSGNIQYLNTVFPTPMTFIDLGYNTSLGSNNNPAVPSSKGLNTIFGVTPSPVADYEVYISVNSGSFGTTGSFPANGNDPTGDFYVAQDTITAPFNGIATILNNAINSDIPGGTGTIEFIAQPYFNCDWTSPGTGPYNDSSVYYGLAMIVRDTGLVQNVSITDNSYGYYLSGGFIVPPFTADPNNLQGATASCSGLSPYTVTINSLDINTIYNFTSFGGSIYT